MLLLLIMMESLLLAGYIAGLAGGIGRETVPDVRETTKHNGAKYVPAAGNTLSAVVPIVRMKPMLPVKSSTIWPEKYLPSSSVPIVLPVSPGLKLWDTGSMQGKCTTRTAKPLKNKAFRKCPFGIPGTVATS